MTNGILKNPDVRRRVGERLTRYLSHSRLYPAGFSVISLLNVNILTMFTK